MFFEQEKHKKINKYTRYFISIILVVCVLIVYSARLIQLQVAEYDEHARVSRLAAAAAVRTTAARGEILDRHGRVIAYNREGFNIVMDYAHAVRGTVNNIIMRVVDVLRENEDEWRDRLPITESAPFEFCEDATELEISTMRTRLELNEYATAEDCVYTMIEDFGLESFSPASQRILMGIRYTMLLEDFSMTFPFTLAEDISENTRARLLESSDMFAGMNVTEVSVRQYAYDDLATHLIGTVGPIFAEEWESFRERGYAFSDYVGRSGVELAFEEYLRGQDGISRVVTNPDTGETETVVQSAAVAGHSVLLTLDLDLQRASQEALDRLIRQMRRDDIFPVSASIVTVKVNGGEILASANYPYFTIYDYKNNFETLINDTRQPLFNRAFQGSYPPGSTIKSATASVGLTVGTINRNTRFNCRQFYDYYEDMTFQCLGRHGYINVIDAISDSCNYFFFDTARLTGINPLNEYFRLLGLGVRTGVELPEAAGTLAGPAFASSIGALWNPGDTLQASIGQSFNLFTPLQLATSTATIANGGTRYRSQLLREVRSHDLSRQIRPPSTEVIANTGISEAAIDAVKLGMHTATFEGTAARTFADFPLQTGGKTGTAETVGDRTNSLYIAFAPFENPEIAVAINVEHGFAGYRSMPAVRDVFQAYFFGEYNSSRGVPFGRLVY